MLVGGGCGEAAVTSARGGATDSGGGGGGGSPGGGGSNGAEEDRLAAKVAQALSADPSFLSALAASHRAPSPGMELQPVRPV